MGEELVKLMNSTKCVTEPCRGDFAVVYYTKRRLNL